MLKIVTVYTASPRLGDGKRPIPVDMAYGRWFKISEALARIGYQVDMAVPDEFADSLEPFPWADCLPSLKMKPLSEIRWREYDVVKTEFHRGFETLTAFGGADHPFIISKLGSVVGPKELPGIYFYGKICEELYLTQEQIAQTSRYVTVLSESAKTLWENCFGSRTNLLLVPGAADADIPSPQENPYPEDGKKCCIFAGNMISTLNLRRIALWLTS